MRGKEAEDRAAAYLEGQGLRILARNWRCRGGEIDLIAESRGTLVFVEVRERASSRFGGAAASIGTTKQRRLLFAAEMYLAGLKRVPPCRFDAVLFNAGHLEWLQDAIQAGS